MSAELVYGKHTVAGLLESDPGGVLELWVLDAGRDSRTRSLARSAEVHGIAVHRVARRTLDRLAPGASHQGVAARYRAVAARAPDLDALLDAVDDHTLLLVLDGVADPHNLGACLRSAAAAGASAVLVPRSRAAGLTPTVRKVASGGAEAVPLVRVANLARALARLGEAGVWRVGTAAGAPRPLYDARLTGPLALVLGGEHEGLRRLTRESCDELVGISMSGAVASLNVSVAAGVCLFEALRQRTR